MKSIEIFQENFFVEGESQDRRYREQAVEIYRKIAERLPQIPINEYRKASLKGNAAFIINADKLGIDEIASIVVTRPFDKSVVGGYDDNTDALYVFVDMDVFARANNDVFAKKLKSSNFRKTIVHELIHKFDNERTNYNRRTSNMSPSGYYNSPDEYNAYYQEAVDHFEKSLDKLKNLGREDIIKTRFGKFSDFSNYMFNAVLEKDFVKHINKDTETRLKKRLYRFWEEIISPLVTQ